jgi:sorbitol/mannitol transport system substrate-binding protein
MKRFLKAGLVLALIGTGVVSQAATELVIATVNNGHMIEMQKLTPSSKKPTPTSSSSGSRSKKARCASA